MSTKKSEFSKATEKKLWTLRAIDFALLTVPLITYFFIGIFQEGQIVTKKVCLLGTTTIALILTLFNIIAKKQMRSAIWIMIIGLYVAIDNLMPLIITLAVCTILDEFILSPCIERLRIKYLASKTTDERLEFESAEQK